MTTSDHIVTAKHVVVVIGPTASGKSALGVEIARGLGGEIINGDAYQLYRGMDVGTAKPTASERSGVPHHLFDVLDVTQPASVAAFQRDARAAIAECHARGVTPVLVGGSSLYVRAVLDPLDFPGTEPAVRARWQSLLDRGGPERLHALLAERDPVAAAEILPTNGRRLVRALEVIEITGQPFIATMPPHVSIYSHLTMLGLAVDREVLNDRLTERVDRMWAAGLVDEVRGLRGQGIEQGDTAGRAIGYQQVLAFLRGEISEAQAKEDTVIATRKFARRQERLFRQDPRIHWL